MFVQLELELELELPHNKKEYNEEEEDKNRGLCEINFDLCNESIIEDILKK